MGISNLQGTPWHIETIRKNESEPRRHRSRCAYYHPLLKINKQCHGSRRCIGSARCYEYSQISEEDYLKKKKETQAVKRIMKTKGYSLNKALKEYAERKRARAQ